MSAKVIRDNHRGMDALRKLLSGLDDQYVVAGLVGTAESTGKPAGDTVIGYASANEFGAVIKGRTGSITHYRSIRTNKLTSKSKAMAEPDNFYAKDHQVTYKGHTIPSRPFMRSWYDENLEKLYKFAQRQIMSSNDPQVIFNRIGVFASDGIRKRIKTARSWAKPNARLTIQKKGSSAPLIDKGIMINSVSFDIRRK